MDDTTAPGSPHELLLRLAGRVDDDLLADARELVAVGEDGHALELVTAALAADDTVLPPAVRAELVTAAKAARIDLDAEAVLAPAAPDTTAHRFSATAAADVPVVAAARELPARLRDGIRLRLTWRQTPAGPAPTPLPYPVLLVETPEDGRPGEVLAYQVGAAMARSGAHVAVEVLTSGRPLTTYHAAALRDSTPLSGDVAPRPASPSEKVESVVAEVVEEVTASHRTAAPEVSPTAEERPVDLFAVDDEPAPRPVPMRAWQSGRRRRGFGEQAVEAEADDDLPEGTDGPLPSPVPLARRTRPRPVGDADAERAFAADPLVGPLDQPLMDPVLDPTPSADERAWSNEWASGGWAEAAEPITDTGAPVVAAVPPVEAPAAHGSAPPAAAADPDDNTAVATRPHSVTAGSQNAAAAGPYGTPTGPRNIFTDATATGSGPQSAPHSTPAVTRNVPTGTDPHSTSAAPHSDAGSDTHSTPAEPRSIFTDTAASGPSAHGNGAADRSTGGSHSLVTPPDAAPRTIDTTGAPGAAAEPHGTPDVAPAGPQTPTAVPSDHAAGAHALTAGQHDHSVGSVAGPHDAPTDPAAQLRAQGPNPGPAHALADPPTGPVGAPVPGSPMAEALLKPEALARLSDADRELLTRLQAELAGGASAHPHGGGPNGSNGPHGPGSNGAGPA